MKNYHECAVIGGGLAGSTAAYYLAKFGYRVAVLEKAQAAHHKVCGEFLSFEALVFLNEMGILLNDDTPVVKHFRLYSPHSKASFTFPLPGRGVSRYKLDEELLNNAKNAGAEVFRGICVRDYHKESDGLIKIETNTEDFYTKHLFVAIGKHDLSKERKRLGKDNAYIGFKTHIRLRSMNEKYGETTVLFTFPGGYGGICPVEGGLMNFCFVIKKGVYKALHGNFEKAIAFLRRSNSQLNFVLQEADFIGSFCAVGHIPYGFLCPQNNQEGVYFLGDQRMVIPSFTGDGMAIALSTAKSSVYEFNSRQKGPKVRFQPMQRILQKQMRWALMGHTILKSSQLVDICAVIPGLKSFLIDTIFKKTRISITEDAEHDFQAAEFKNNCSRR
jgi:flavin-dependent dehydrogenase